MKSVGKLSKIKDGALSVNIYRKARDVHLGSMTDPLGNISTAMGKMEDELVQQYIKQALSTGHPATQVLDALRNGLEIVGQRYNSGEYFLSELIISGQIMKDAMKTLEPYMKSKSFATKGRIVLGTALGDIHDIGKNIVKTMLLSQGYEVLDLGVDVPADRFTLTAKDRDTKVIGISALLSTAVPVSMEVVKQLEKDGRRSQIKVILGGASVRQNMTESYHVDAAVVGVTDGLDIIKRWTS